MSEKDLLNELQNLINNIDNKIESKVNEVALRHFSTKFQWLIAFLSAMSFFAVIIIFIFNNLITPLKEDMKVIKADIKDIMARQYQNQANAPIKPQKAESPKNTNSRKKASL